MKFLSLEDETGVVEAVLLPDAYQRPGRATDDPRAVHRHRRGRGPPGGTLAHRLRPPLLPAPRPAAGPESRAQGVNVPGALRIRISEFILDKGGRLADKGSIEVAGHFSNVPDVRRPAGCMPDAGERSGGQARKVKFRRNDWRLCAAFQKRQRLPTPRSLPHYLLLQRHLVICAAGLRTRRAKWRCSITGPAVSPLRTRHPGPATQRRNCNRPTRKGRGRPRSLPPSRLWRWNPAGSL